jgi:hypothetical protein
LPLARQGEILTSERATTKPKLILTTAILGAALGGNEYDWRLLVAEAETISITRTFQRLGGLIGRALELADELSAGDLRALIGSRTCRAYGIDPAPTTKETDCAA